MSCCKLLHVGNATIKADTYAHVSSGVPPQEYRFELLDFQDNVSKNPFDKMYDILFGLEKFEITVKEQLEQEKKKESLNEVLKNKMDSYSEKISSWKNYFFCSDGKKNGKNDLKNLQDNP